MFYGNSLKAFLLLPDSDEIDQSVIKPFTSEQDVTHAVFKIDEAKFKIFCGANFMVPNGTEVHSQWLKKLTIHFLDVFVSEANYVNPLKEVCMLKVKIDIF